MSMALIKEMTDKGPLDFSKPMHSRSVRKPQWWLDLQRSLDEEEAEHRERARREGKPWP
jgi:hypothetical protein